ncbi:hypothetical protein GW17_00051910 [Ensete ventricosum]|nr:hypothetical protein GW17_00051910 [Ensete ventricosum]
MIPLLPLQEFMSLISVQRKLHASTPCSIFYVDSLYVAWTHHQVPPKLFRPSICIELMVALTPTIPRVSPLLSLVFTSVLGVASFDVVISHPLLGIVIHPPMNYLMRDHTMTSVARSVR